MDFATILKSVKIPHRSKKEWEIFFPNNITQEQLQSVINTCRENQLVNWHIIHPTTEILEKNPKEEIRMYWDYS